MVLLTLLISSRSSACIQIGLWSSGDEILCERVREQTWTLYGDLEPTANGAGLKGCGCPYYLCVVPNLALPPDLTTHHPQIQTPAHGHGSGSLCIESQPQSTCPALGSRKPRRQQQKPRNKRWKEAGLARLRQLHFLASVSQDPTHSTCSHCGVKVILARLPLRLEPLAAE